jgi:large subunit ribosomal protein L17
MRGRRLGRTSSHRKALGRNLVTALFHHGRIVTTAPKAKEYRAMAEKLITLGKQKTLHRVRQAAAVLRDREALSRLFDEIGPSFADRAGGYTRIVKLPDPRLGDKASRVYFELVNYVPKPKERTDRAAGRKDDDEATPRSKAESKSARKGSARLADKGPPSGDAKPAKGQGKTKGKGKTAEADESEE